MAGNLVMNANKITGLAMPTLPGDATSKEYVDSFAYVSPEALTTILAGYLPLSGSTMTGGINMGTQKITGLGTPTLATDAVTKAYSDAVTVTQGLNILVTGTGQSKQVAGNPQLTGITSITLQSNSPTLTNITMLKTGGGACSEVIII